MKDRAAISMLQRAFDGGKIDDETVIIESSSGNMGIGLAQACSYLGLRLICVVDAKTTSQNLNILRAYGSEISLVADPDPVAAGGAARLREAGIEVEIGVLARHAAAQNAPFLHRFREPARPFVALKLATTIDGRIADLAGRSRWISGTEAQEYVHWLRAGFDAVAVGGRTARADDPQLTVRGSVEPRNPPRRVVFDAAADLDPDLTLVRTARRTPTLLVTSPTAPGERVDRLAACGVTVLPAANLGEGLHVLRRAGVKSLLVEGGGRLAGALLGQALADRYYWLQSPLWLGERGVPGVAGLPSEPLDRAARWHPVERRALGEDTLLVLDRD
jgi:diaminohydroxyphosphoribosylaminopyrimidine deaminase/5-amino-6-(5-phosphoribosylamino)uracil reductase